MRFSPSTAGNPDIVALARVRSAVILLCLLLLSAGSVAAQVPEEARTVVPGAGEAAAGALGTELSDRLSIAVSSPDYPVTPGDTYELIFTVGGELTTTVVTVASNYTLNLNIFGTIDTRGLNYVELRSQVENAVTEAYPQSMPAFRLVSIGLFEVTIHGAIDETTRVNAWGLSRLGDVVQPLLRSYSSSRRVLVTSATTGPRTYDLFSAINLGETAENPRVRPGDAVRVLPVGSLVTVRGEVNRPGRYEILPGDTLSNAVEYAGGFAPNADAAGVRLDRARDGRTSTDRYDISGADADGPELRDSDQITVYSGLRSRPLVFIEGALEPTDEETAAAGQTIEIVEEDMQDVEAGYLRIAEYHHEGLMLSDVIVSLRSRIATFADLGRTSVLRAADGEVVEVDGSQLLYGYGDSTDVRLEPFDTVFIPSRRVSVLVTGPVAEPGLYLYVPGQSAEYYIRRAGGYDREVSATGEYMILDSAGNERPPGSKVRPGDRIEVQRNNFVYQFNRHFPVIISGLSIVTTVISILTLINQ
ncbi:MAG: SLBB domain-containing protein [Spirochaetaceae bacterium]